MSYLDDMPRFYKLTLVVERVLEDRILRELRELRAPGWTVVEVHGEGRSGVRASEFEGKSLKFESICNADTAERILRRMSERYLGRYSAIAYAEEVRVLRPAPFSDRAPPTSGAP